MMKILSWWYALSLPANRARNTPMDRQLCRYEELTSSFVFFLLFCFLLLSPLMFFFSSASPSSPYTTIFGFVILLLAWIFGRVRLQKLSALSVILYILEMVLLPIFLNPNLPAIFMDINCLIVAVILAGALISPRIAIIVAACISLLVVGIVFIQPHPAAYMNTISIYNFSVTLIVPILIYFLVALCMYFILSQLNQAIFRADRAEEIIALQTEIAAYEMQRKEELSQLEEGVLVIAEAHRSFSNGDVFVRVPVDNLSKFEANSMLVRIAISLNNLFNRVQRWRDDADMAVRTQAAVAEIVKDLQRQNHANYSATLPSRTGTLIDPLLLELKSTHSHR